jgi:hypothetical protein
MAYVRFQIDGAIPQATYNALPTATKAAIRNQLLQLKSLCQKINNEDTVRFKYHICRHDEDKPCGEEQDI